MNNGMFARLNVGGWFHRAIHHHPHHHPDPTASQRLFVYCVLFAVGIARGGGRVYQDPRLAGVVV